MNHHFQFKVADEDEEGFIYVALEGMNDVENATWTWNSWNMSSSTGPLGEVCDPSLNSWQPCYESCRAMYGSCDYVFNTCDWTSCYDDITYTEIVLYDVLSRFCVDTDKVKTTNQWSSLL